MQKLNILKIMYSLSPMNFYFLGKRSTIIKSTNNSTLGYKFNTKFTDGDIAKVWEEVKVCKRLSTIIIFLALITLLYAIIFPKFPIFVNNAWFINAILILAIVGVICQISTKLCTIIFEKRLVKKFGEYEKTIFPEKVIADKKYYKLFKTELIKAFTLILVIVSIFFIGSPFKTTQKCIEKEKYNEAIKITTIGSKLFPIAQEWYSLRGYARFYTGDYDGAINDYDQAYKLSADGFNIMNFDNKIFVKYYLGDYESAILDFDTEIRNASTEDEKDQFLWDKAQFLYYIKKYNEALSLYSELISKAENDRIYLLKDRLYMERAQVFKALGKSDMMKDDLLNAGISEEDLYLTPIPQPTLMFDEF